MTRAKYPVIAIIALTGIGLHFLLRFFAPSAVSSWNGMDWATAPLLTALVLGGLPLVIELIVKLIKRDFGSDLLAGASIVTAVLLGEYLAGTVVVLMLAGGQSLEAYAARRASSVLNALAQRMPSTAHHKVDGQILDVSLSAIAIGDVVVVFPHESCPVDGVVLEGHGVMDESYLTGEPYRIEKAPGAAVLSGSINGETVITIRAERLPSDSRYAKIMQVMRESEQRRPRMRRLADQLGAYYTPVAMVIALIAWIASGDPVRFLAVLVVATPCPLILAIPVAIIGAISLAARRGIVIKDPAVLENVSLCRTAIFDKTGTLTYGEPRLIELAPAPGVSELELLHLVASLERYSKHPLSQAVMEAAKSRRLAIHEATAVSERPGEGLRGTVSGRSVEVTSRKKLERAEIVLDGLPPSSEGGLECLVLIDGVYGGAMRFRDEPRIEGARFVEHLAPRHHFERVMIISGDRESEVRYLAEKVGIEEVYSSQNPEKKLELVRAATQRAPTIFMGDGINDAPALTAATVGIAFGDNSITTEAAGAIILDSSLQRVDELLHISYRMRSIALQSAVGGMALSTAGMIVAALGWIAPVHGAVLQELIDVLAVSNALRVARSPSQLTDYGQ